MDGDTRLRAKLWPIRTTAAGGINTSIASFANWLRLHLDKGEFEGQRLLSPNLIRELQTPRVHVMASEFAEFGDVHYGLGFGSHSYRGERVVWPRRRLDRLEHADDDAARSRRRCRRVHQS